MIESKDIEQLFLSQLARIQDGDLWEKVVRCWVKGCDQGRWKTVEELKKMPFTLLIDTRGIDFISHTIAVTEGAIGLAEAQIKACSALPYSIDMDRLVAGGLLHDIGKLLEFESDGAGGFRKSHSGLCARHPISGAILAAQEGVPQEILNIIICHSKEGDGRPQVIETILIHQADFATFDPLVMLAGGKLIQ